MIQPFIVTHPEICQGKPIIAETQSWSRTCSFAKGHTVKQIAKDHPRLSEDAVIAAIRYASAIVDAEKDTAILGSAEAALVQMRYASDTEDVPPGLRAVDLSTPVGFEGRMTPK